MKNNPKTEEKKKLNFPKKGFWIYVVLCICAYYLSYVYEAYNAFWQKNLFRRLPLLSDLNEHSFLNFFALCVLTILNAYILEFLMYSRAAKRLGLYKLVRSVLKRLPVVRHYTSDGERRGRPVLLETPRRGQYKLFFDMGEQCRSDGDPFVKLQAPPIPGDQIFLDKSRIEDPDSLKYLENPATDMFQMPLSLMAEGPDKLVTKKKK